METIQIRVGTRGGAWGGHVLNQYVLRLQKIRTNTSIDSLITQAETAHGFTVKEWAIEAAA
jgi:hypothetical protein